MLWVSLCYTVGSLVWKKDFLQEKRRGGKLDYPWMDPFMIVESLGKGLFKLQEVNGKKASFPTIYTYNINLSS